MHEILEKAAYTASIAPFKTFLQMIRGGVLVTCKGGVHKRQQLVCYETCLKEDALHNIIIRLCEELAEDIRRDQEKEERQEKAIERRMSFKLIDSGK